MKPQYTDEVKGVVVEVLRALPRGNQKVVAKALEVSERTLRQWKRSSPKKRGRPTKAITQQEMIRIGREWRLQGYPGSRPIIRATGIRARRVREVIAHLKNRRAKRAEAHRNRVRVRIKVKKPHAFAVIDGASLARGDDYLVYRDRGTLSVEAIQCHGHLNASHTITLFEQLKRKGRLPLVIGSDNGSPFCATEVQDYLQRNQVVHLRSLPRVPQQNGSAESAVNDYKRLVRQGLGGKACQILNERRLRASLGWKTAAQVGQTAFIDENTRAKFFELVQTNTQAAVFGTQSEYARRQAEREAILQTMENFELITRTRGGLPLRAKAEVIT